MDRTAEFVALWTRFQPEVYALIRAMVPNRADAEDLLQETSQVLWKKFDAFETGTNFLAWARQVARFEVQHFARQQRRGRLQFSEPLVAALADESVATDNVGGETRDALQHCLARLKPAERDLLTRRYDAEVSMQELARQTQASVQTLYSKLKRIRRRLFECINRTLAADGGAS